MIPLSAPSIGEAEIKLVTDCLKSGWVSSVGQYVDGFERAIADVSGARYGVATASGTSALHLALLVAGVERDDEVLVSNLTFVAPVNAITYVGARPLLVDAEPKFWQMDLDLVEAFLEQRCELRGGRLVNMQTGRRVKALLPVHILGHPVDIRRARALADRFGLVLIEDASESLGASDNDLPLGGVGDIGCFSFNGNKLLTTGGGGMLVSNQKSYAERARHLSTQAKQDPLEYVHDEIGYNYRLTNIQAALGLAQCGRLAGFLARKRQIAERYLSAFSDIQGLQMPAVPPNTKPSWWLFTMLVDAVGFGMSSRELLQALAALGIQTRPLWQPIHMNVPYAEAQRLGGAVSIDLYRRSISLPCSVDLTDDEQEQVIEAIRLLNS
jgi:perosamine synthetase